MAAVHKHPQNELPHHSKSALKAVTQDIRWSVPVVFGRTRDLLLLGGVFSVVAALSIWLFVSEDVHASTSRVATWTIVLLWSIASLLAIRVSTDPRLDRGSRRAWTGFSAAFGAVAITSSWHLVTAMALYQHYLTLAIQVGFLVAIFQMPSAPQTVLDKLTLALDACTWPLAAH